MPDLEVLRRCREEERAQAHFYRALAAEAVDRDEAEMAERLNDLHADEQHHLSRLTARLLELGEPVGDLSHVERITAPFPEWQVIARRREAEEVARYQEILAGSLEAETRLVIDEILESELHHLEELGGKWMPA